MGMRHADFFTAARIYGCKECKAHLTTGDLIMSRSFNGQHGKAYLFDRVINVSFGDPEDRHMTTGLHTVRDIRCNKCDTILGWKYDRAYVQHEKYKEGKFILEKNLMMDVI